MAGAERMGSRGRGYVRGVVVDRSEGLSGPSLRRDLAFALRGNGTQHGVQASLLFIATSQWLLVPFSPLLLL